MNRNSNRPRHWGEWLTLLSGTSKADDAVTLMYFPRPGDLTLPRTLRCAFMTRFQLVCSAIGVVLGIATTILMASPMKGEQHEVWGPVLGLVFGVIWTSLIVFVFRSTITVDETGIEHRALGRRCFLPWRELSRFSDWLVVRGSRGQWLWLQFLSQPTLELLSIVGELRPDIFEPFMARSGNGFSPDDDGLLLRSHSKISHGGAIAICGLMIGFAILFLMYFPEVGWVIPAAIAVAAAIVYGYYVFRWRRELASIYIRADGITINTGGRHWDLEPAALQAVELLGNAYQPTAIQFTVDGENPTIRLESGLAMARAYHYIREMYGLP